MSYYGTMCLTGNETLRHSGLYPDAPEVSIFAFLSRDMHRIRAHSERRIFLLTAMLQELQRRGLELGFLLSEHDVHKLDVKGCISTAIVDYIARSGSGKNRPNLAAVESTIQLFNLFAEDLNEFGQYTRRNVIQYKKLMQEADSQKMEEVHLCAGIM